MELLSNLPCLLAQVMPDLVKTQSSAGDATIGPGSMTDNLIAFAWMIGTIFVVFILPFILGRFLAKSLRMTNYAGKFGLVIASVVGSALILTQMPLKYGIDIKGGMNLVYELDKTQLGEKKAQSINSSTLVPRLTQRLNPSGTKELVIRPSGDDKIEIIIPDVDQYEIASIKKQIEEAGILEFMVVANQTDHQDIIQLARKQASSDMDNVRLQRSVMSGEGSERREVGVWRAAGRNDRAKEGIFPLRGYSPGDIIRDSKTGQIVEGFPGSTEELAFEKWLAAKGISDIDILLALEKGGNRYQRVTGDDLDTTRPSMDKNGFPEVEFAMKQSGAARLQKLTYAIRPDASSGFHRRMAILLDGRILSAPNLNQPISKEGVIQGRFSTEEVKYLVNILESGALPATLNKTPIAENQVGAAMGQDAIKKAYFASLLALIATFVFVIVYYGFSGIVASIALIINLLLIFASIILIQQPITLAGLAGIVLSVGMSFDANVLVFERIREEIAKKSTGRMAIRNGFDRAWTTIFDSNFTTLITAIVLYWLGTDQVRGFAVSLIIGLVISMFTAVFCSHVFFDIAERLRIVNFWMADAIAFVRKSFLGNKDIDFMGKTKICMTVSAILIAIGLVATFLRGREILDIDFNGGTSVTFSVDKPMETDKMRDLILKIFDKDENGAPIQTTLTGVEVQGFPPNSVFKLDTSIAKVEQLSERLIAGFDKNESGERLASYRAEVGEPTEIKPASESTTGSRFKQAIKFSSAVQANSAKIDAAKLLSELVKASKTAGSEMVDSQFNIFPVGVEGWTPESQVGYSEWTVDVQTDAETNKKIMDALSAQVKAEPVWESIARIEGRVAGEAQQSAIMALVVSMLFIIVYIWFRFQKVSYGLAAVVALIHDVLITLGFLAISHWLYEPLKFLLIEDFKISLTIVAAFLTIIGYSLNDTIVVFDRIREVKGKSPKLTREMLNVSVNQTLGRTILTSSTTIIAILLLFIFGGDGVHGFCYVMLIGIIVGTFSSIFVAAPILLWIASREKAVSRIGA
jgi:SecD/SecF fusion protein